MRRTLAALALLTLTVACSSDDDTQTSQPDMAEAIADAGIPPEPDQATADAYIAALDAIDPRIVHRDPDPADLASDIEAAIDRGRNACSTITDTSGQLSDVDAVNLRFTSPDAPDGWGPEIAGQILAVVKQYLCPD